MSNIIKSPEQLIAFIQSSGQKNPSDDSLVGNSWSEHDWEIQLTINIPNWQEMVADPSIHDQLNLVKPKDGAYRLYEVLVGAGRFELARKWFYKSGGDRQYVAESWLISNIALWFQFDERIKNSLIDNCRRGLIDKMTIKIWRDLTQDMKNNFLSKLFEDVEIISKLMKELSRDLHFFHREDFAGYASKNFHLNEMISRISAFAYVCSPEIQKIRYVIEDAQDLVYLKRIDDTIEEYRISWRYANAHFTHLSTSVSHRKSAYIPNPNERELIARLLSKAQRVGYSIVALPTIYQSYEIPPLFVSHPELEYPTTDQTITQDPDRRAPEYYNVEELLGCYQPEHETIILYERGIRWLGLKDYDSDWLRSVVLIHELAHWMMHKLPKQNFADWPTALYKSTKSDLHEAWAQLLTCWMAEEVGNDFKATFEQLNRNQSQPYHLYKQFPIATYSTSKIMTSLEMLRALTTPATLNDWHEILK